MKILTCVLLSVVVASTPTAEIKSEDCPTKFCTPILISNLRQLRDNELLTDLQDKIWTYQRQLSDLTIWDLVQWFIDNIYKGAEGSRDRLNVYLLKPELILKMLLDRNNPYFQMFMVSFFRPAFNQTDDQLHVRERMMENVALELEFKMGRMYRFLRSNEHFKNFFIDYEEKIDMELVTGVIDAFRKYLQCVPFSPSAHIVTMMSDGFLQVMEHLNKTEFDFEPLNITSMLNGWNKFIEDSPVDLGLEVQNLLSTPDALQDTYSEINLFMSYFLDDVFNGDVIKSELTKIKVTSALEKAWSWVLAIVESGKGPCETARGLLFGSQKLDLSVWSRYMESIFPFPDCFKEPAIPKVKLLDHELGYYDFCLARLMIVPYEVLRYFNLSLL